MKKMIMALGVLFVLTTSCRKDWVCTCTYNEVGGTNSYTSDSDFKGFTEDEVTDACNNLEGTSYNGQSEYAVTCDHASAE